MSGSAYDCFLDRELERYYEEMGSDEDFNDSLYPPDDEPRIDVDDFANYDGWDDM